MLACRVVPAFLLKGRELPQWLNQALGYIPPAAFAALVANDLLSATLLSTTINISDTKEIAATLAALWPSLISWLAAAVVIVVARRSKSLIWCIISGVTTYGLLLLLPI
jgi:branched-subunit amino acid transport protein